MNRHAGGFTLIETVMVIVLLGAGLATILSVLAQGSRDVGLNSDTQVAARLAQERMEQILADKNNPNNAYGYPRIVPGNYPAENIVLPGTPGSFDRTVTITPIALTGTDGCPAGGRCQEVVVRVTRGGAPDTLAAATLLVTNY